MFVCPIRYRTEQKRVREGLPPRAEIVPSSSDEQAVALPPPNAPPETVFLCQKVYDVKLKRFLKNPQVLYALLCVSYDIPLLKPLEDNKLC